MKGTFDALERAFSKFNIDFYLIGAFARDMWLNHLEYLPERRTTLDIDFSVYIHEHKQFESLKAFLVDTEGFKKDEQPYRLHSRDGHIVDLIPFGGIEKNNIVYLNGNPPMELSVFGNDQVFSHSSVLQSNDTSFKICTLPGLCILKLVAGNEKPERRDKDFGDFFYILENYFEIAADTIFDVEHEDLIDGDFEPAIAAATVLGRQLRPIVNESIELKAKILEILTRLKEGFNDNEIDQMYKMDKKDKKILRFKLLASLTQGVE